MSHESPNLIPEGKKSFRRNLIQKEFRSILESGEYEVKEDTGAIMILSAKPHDLGAEPTFENEGSPDNIARIELGIEVYKKIAAKKLGKTVEELTDDDLKNQILPMLVLNGETEQLPMMRKVTIDELHFPAEKVREINCGDRGVGNTKTNFEVTANDSELGKLKHLTLITTSWHIPRVVRSATKYLPKDMNFDLIGVPFKSLPFNVYKMVREEVKKIENYSKKGDISKYPRS